MNSLRARMKAPEAKRLLALDGGGIRGLITIEILAKLEELLREATEGGGDFVLADYFDYVGGTSTGAIIATCISLGLSVDRIRQFYLVGGEAMFKPAPVFKRIYYRFMDAPLTARLRDFLRSPDGRERTLGDEDLRTLLLLVMRNDDTDSPWPISNNPDAKYNQLDLADCNLKLPLWQLIRASTAAPTYFPAQVIDLGPKPIRFVDGALTPYNNPAFALFLMATLPQYCLQWEMGEEKMLLVSIGTGILTGDARKRSGTLLHLVKSVPSALIDGALNEQDRLCRVFGRCRFGSRWDGEIGDLIENDETASADPFAPKNFTYVRYNPALTQQGLTELGVGNIRAEDVQRMDSASHMPELTAVGRAYANVVDLAHFGPHDPRVQT